MKTRKKNTVDAEWRRICSAITNDCVRISIPRAFLPTLTLFFHHVSDAMAGDDRPDHGLAKMRQSREHYQHPFYFLYRKFKRAEKRMKPSHLREVIKYFHRYIELLEEQKHRFQEKIRKTAGRS